MSSTKKVAILGAGPTGLSAGYVFSKSGILVTIYEATSDVGGLARSFDLWNMEVELGPKLFDITSSPEAQKIYSELIDISERTTYERNTSLLLDGNVLAYPPQVKEVLKFIGISGIGKNIFSYFNFMLTPNKNRGSLEYVASIKMGPYLYKRILRDYCQKLWGISSENISGHFFNSLVGTTGVVRKLLSKFSLQNNENHSASFMYSHPTNGLSVLWDRLSGSIKKNSGQILLSTLVTAITSSPEGIEIKDDKGNQNYYDYVLSTIPIPVLMKLLPGCSNLAGELVGKLKFKNLILIYVNLKTSDIFTEQSIYLFDPKLRPVRISSLSNLKQKKTRDNGELLLIEYWVNSKHELWNMESDDCLIEAALFDLESSGLVGDSKLLDYKVIRLRNAYIIPEMGFDQILTETHANLEKYPYVDTIGRNYSKSFNYSMVDAMTDGIRKANQKLKEFKT